MLIKFMSKTLERLDGEGDFSGDYEPQVVSAFRLRIQLLRAAPSERTLVPLKALRMQRIPGNEDHHYVMRVNDEFCLSVEFDGGEKERLAIVDAMTPYREQQEAPQ